MSSPKRIAILYSKGRNFADAVAAVRAAHPDALVVLVAPPGCAVPPDCLVIPLPEYRVSMLDLEPVRDLLARVRRERFDAFVVIFDSPRLRLFAALSGAQEGWLCSLDGSLAPMDTSIASAVANIVVRRIRGRCAYAWFWLCVRLFRV